MGSVASLKLPQGFCFGTPNTTHDLFASFLEVYSASSDTIFYSATTPANPTDGVKNSIWVKLPDNQNSNNLEMYFYIKKYAGSANREWCKFYAYSIGDIEYAEIAFDGDEEIETARPGKPNLRPFAVCDGGTYGGFVTPDLRGDILFGGMCGTSNAANRTLQEMQVLKDASPTSTDADLNNPATRLNIAGLQPLRMYQESGSAITSYVGPDGSTPLLDPLESVREFVVNKVTPSNRVGERKVILKADQCPSHKHRYGWETWQQKGNAHGGGSGNAAVATSVSATTPTTNTYETGGSTALNLSKPHDNLPPVYVGNYRIYIGYGT